MGVIIGVFAVFFKDTPMSLITKTSAEHAYKSFIHIAQFNGKDVESTGLSVDYIKEIQINYKLNYLGKKTAKVKKFTPLDLFRYPSLRGMTLILIAVDLVYTLQYFTPTLMLNQFNFNIYISGLSLGSANLLAGIGAYLAISRFNRRQTGCISFTIIMLCSIILVFIWDQDATEVTDIKANIATLVLIFFI